MFCVPRHRAYLPCHRDKRQYRIPLEQTNIFLFKFVPYLLHTLSLGELIRHVVCSVAHKSESCNWLFCARVSILPYVHVRETESLSLGKFNPLNAELNPICHLLALLRAHHILHVSRIRVNNLPPFAQRGPRWHRG